VKELTGSGRSGDSSEDLYWSSKIGDFAWKVVAGEEFFPEFSSRISAIHRKTLPNPSKNGDRAGL
jgi:hypothetical protein